MPRRTYELTIVFFVPSTNETQVATVALPRTGPTQERRFPFSAPERGAEVTILISVVYKGRTIQAAELTGIAAEDPQRASARIGFRIAVPTPKLEVLHVRESFDSTLRIASAPDGRMVGVVTTEPPQTVALRGFGDAPLGIRDLLTEMATSAPAVQHLDSDESVELLGNLALLGGQLNATLADESHDLLHTRKVKRIQIVQSDPDLFLPIEFVYDLPPPAEPAKLCDNWKLALEEGTCSASFHEVNELGNLKQVCPSGFWAISKIIERQSVTPMLSSELSGASAAMWSDPVPRRKR
ncbi:MAG: hypothetical protein JO057_09125, partial [Chloroflexi bacterium]|nr:hypothetical protein [Chloroflexota bacterium]